jgi:hypothetical protein
MNECIDSTLGRIHACLLCCLQVVIRGLVGSYKVETDCLFVTFIQAIYLLQGEDPTNLPKLARDLREKAHAFINEAIANHDSDETNTPPYTIIREIVSEHG